MLNRKQLKYSAYAAALGAIHASDVSGAIVQFKINPGQASPGKVLLNSGGASLDVYGTAGADLRLRTASLAGGQVVMNGGGVYSGLWKPGYVGGNVWATGAASSLVNMSAKAATHRLALAAESSALFGFRTAAGITANAGWLKVSRTGAGKFYLVSGALGIGESINYGQLAAIPEPTTGAVMGLAALALGARGVRRVRKSREESAATGGDDS